MFTYAAEELYLSVDEQLKAVCCAGCSEEQGLPKTAYPSAWYGRDFGLHEERGQAIALELLQNRGRFTIT